MSRSSTKNGQRMGKGGCSGTQGGVAAIAALASLCGGSLAFAAKTPVKHLLPAGKAPALAPALSAEAFDRGVQDAETRGGRSTASADLITDQALSDSFKNLRNQVIGGPVIQDGKETAQANPGISTPAQLHAFLLKLNDDAFYATLAPDAQFAAAQMAPLIVMHGLFNRSIELIEPSPISHMTVVAMLRAIGAGAMVYFPTDQWKAGIEYITMPSADMGSLIATEDDIHRFLEAELVPALTRMKDRLEKLSFADKPIYFDNKVFYGSANFLSDRDRYLRLGEAERKAALAGAYFSLSGVESLNAYAINGLFNAMDELAKSYGFHTIFGFNPDATQAKKRFDILRAANQKSGLFNLRPNGEAWMQAAYSSLTYAVANATWSWTELRNHASDPAAYGNLLDPRSFAASSRIVHMGLGNLKYIAVGQGQAGLQSAVVASDTRQVTLQNFYLHPPKSLVDLMPTGFDQSAYTMDMSVNGKNRKWHNFLAGRPNAWPIAEFQKIFPEVHTSDDVAATARVLSQTWGGWLLGIPMSALMI